MIQKINSFSELIQALADGEIKPDEIAVYVNPKTKMNLVHYLMLNHYGVDWTLNENICTGQIAILDKSVLNDFLEAKPEPFNISDLYESVWGKKYR